MRLAKCNRPPAPCVSAPAWLKTAVFAILTVTVVTTRLQAVIPALVTRVEPTAVTVWLQAREEALVRLRYGPEGNNDKQSLSADLPVRRETDFAAALELNGLSPDTVWSAVVLYNGEPMAGQPRLRWRTPPLPSEAAARPPDFTVALLSGLDVPDGIAPIETQSVRILDSIAAAQPAAVIWLGGSVVLRPDDVVGPLSLARRYEIVRGWAPLAGLWTATPHYACPGPSDMGLVGAARDWAGAEAVGRLFALYWPRSGFASGAPEERRLSDCFTWGDATFFLLDGWSCQRPSLPAGTSRNPFDDTARLESRFGDNQLRWLIGELRRSRAVFKIVASGYSFLNPVAHPGHWQSAPREKDRLLEALEKENIPGLFFVSGGKGWGESSRVRRASTYALRELTVSPLIAGAAAKPSEMNYLREPGTLVVEPHFALLEFHGPATGRGLRVRVLNAGGTEIWSENIRASSLQGTGQADPGAE